MRISEYSAALDEMEANNDLAGSESDPTFALRVLRGELSRALWQPWARAEANELIGRADRLLTNMPLSRPDRWGHP